MWRFRNKEIKIQIGMSLIGTAVLVMASGAVWGKKAAYAAFFCCLAWSFLDLARTDGRYRKIRSLAGQIDEVLHGKEIPEFQNFREGDMEILRDEISKMTVRLKEQAELLKKEKTSLADALADISHQIRTPLTSLNILFERMKNPELSAFERRRLLRESGKMLDKIEWLVTTLLKMSKLEAGAVVLTEEDISMPEFLEDVLLPFEVSMDVHEKVCEISGAEGKSFSGDYAWTLEAVQNVVKNALEYTPDGGRLIICCADNPLFVEIKFTDSGTGIPEEDLPHLFERFYKGKNAGAGGFGIGLSLAQMIFTREHAVIQAQNAPEGGGQFRIRFYKTVL